MTVVLNVLRKELQALIVKNIFVSIDKKTELLALVPTLTQTQLLYWKELFLVSQQKQESFFQQVIEKDVSILEVVKNIKDIEREKKKLRQIIIRTQKEKANQQRLKKSIN